MVSKSSRNPNNLRVPSRPPPAPPLPPKDSSPAQSYNSLTSDSFNCGRGAPSESCYSGGFQSVKSVPYSTQSLQPDKLCYIRGSSARSEYEYFSAAASDCGRAQQNYRLPPCYRPSCYCAVPHCVSPILVKSNGFASNTCHCCARPPVNHCNHTSCSQSTVDSAGCQSSPTQPNASIGSALPQKIDQVLPVAGNSANVSSSTPPVPKGRKNISRPKLSISPMPRLKNIYETNNKVKCEPSTYKRHIEQHIERLFKYLRDRQKRLETGTNHAEPNGSLGLEHTIKQLLATQETRHLRSLRTRLSPRDFQEIQILGAGYMGKVVLVEKVDTKKLYAMKILQKSQVLQQNHMAHVIAERDILAEADNEWIVKLYYSFQDDQFLYFILDYVPGGDMMNLLIKQRVFPEYWARFYIAEISLALQFVHDMRFIHRDIKPDNILIDKEGHIKLADFGLCTGFRWTHDLRYYRDDTLHNPHSHSTNDHQSFDEHPTITKALTKRAMEYSTKSRSPSLVGSPNYIAPEVLRQDSTNERLCDWWSVGVILYEMVVGYCPFADLELIKKGEYNPEIDTPLKIQERILNWQQYFAFPSRYDSNSPPFTSDKDNHQHDISEATKSLIRGWICEPHDRLCQDGIQDIKRHPFFEDFDWNRVRKMRPPFVPEIKHEKDTQNFDYPSVQNPACCALGSNMLSNVTGFTYVSFWNRPPDEVQE